MYFGAGVDYFFAFPEEKTDLINTFSKFFRKWRWRWVCWWLQQV